MSTQRRVVYIRAAGRPPLSLRVIGGKFHRIEQLLHPDGSLHNGYMIASGDIAIVTINGRRQELLINEFADISDDPEAVTQSEAVSEAAKRKSSRR